MTIHLGQHAIVIGGSLAGLMTARVLADYFDGVTILERDHIDGRSAVHKCEHADDLCASSSFGALGTQHSDK